MLLVKRYKKRSEVNWRFQWAPTLGGECYNRVRVRRRSGPRTSFNGHPPLGVNATLIAAGSNTHRPVMFQWAPTLGGECYIPEERYDAASDRREVSMGTHPWG